MVDDNEAESAAQRLTILQLRAHVGDWQGRRFVHTDVPLAHAWPLAPQFAHRCDDVFLDRALLGQTDPSLLSLYEATDRALNDVQDLEPEWKRSSDYTELLPEDYHPEDEGFGIEELESDIKAELGVLYAHFGTSDDSSAQRTAREQMQDARRVMAASRDLWSVAASPYRRKGDRVYFVSLPEPLNVGLQVRSMHVDDFLVQVAYRTAADHRKIKCLTRRLDAWRAAAIVAALIGIVALIR